MSISVSKKREIGIDGKIQIGYETRSIGIGH